MTTTTRKQKQAKPKATGERGWDQPNLCFKTGDAEHRVYVLDKGEYFDRRNSTNYKHTFQGPGVVVVTFHAGMTECNEYYVGSQWVWGWIQRLLSGNPEYAVKVSGEFAPTDHDFRDSTEGVRGDKFDEGGRYYCNVSPDRRVV